MNKETLLAVLFMSAVSAAILILAKVVEKQSDEMHDFIHNAIKHHAGQYVPDPYTGGVIFKWNDELTPEKGSL